MLSLIKDGKPVPFGATVSREDADNVGMVGDDGQVYLAGLPLKGTIKAVWGASQNQQCYAKYILPEDSQTKAIAKARVRCL